MSVTELARRESAELQQRYQNWRDADRALETDPSSLVHLNFEDQRDMDRSLSNRASGAKTGSRAMIFGCDWGEGRWPSKGALEFNSVDDRVRVGVPGVFRSLTYLAWLRVDSLPNQWNALALVDTFRTGETHWQIHRDGSVELSVRVEGGVASWDRLVSPPVITPEHAYHVLEIMVKSMESGDTGNSFAIESTFTPPRFDDASLLDGGAHLAHDHGNH